MDTQSICSLEAEKTDSVSIGELSPLTFTAVDGLAFAAMKARLSRSPSRAYAAMALGPRVELLSLSRDGLLPQVDSMSWIDLSSVSEFHSAYQQNHQLWICSSSKRQGFLRTPEDHDETVTFRFCSAVQKAAITAGFGKGVARQLAAAIDEMLDNIYLHSRMPATGLAAFEARAKKFEFVIADGGIGILRSLKGCDEYSSLLDHGDALQVALTDGCSRYGSGSNHGHGFSPLFVGLSNLNGSLRFRSGDHALTIDGRNPKNIPWRKNAKPPISGFLASISIEA
jgi:anti-sigma regulatory factor (Ser/Thr protein kinase)